MYVASVFHIYTHDVLFVDKQYCTGGGLTPMKQVRVYKQTIHDCKY